MLTVNQGVVGLNMGNTELLPLIFRHKAKKNDEKTMLLSRNSMQIVRHYACYCRTISMTFC